MIRCGSQVIQGIYFPTPGLRALFTSSGENQHATSLGMALL